MRYEDALALLASGVDSRVVESQTPRPSAMRAGERRTLRSEALLQASSTKRGNVPEPAATQPPVPHAMSSPTIRRTQHASRRRPSGISAGDLRTLGSTMAPTLSRRPGASREMPAPLPTLRSNPSSPLHVPVDTSARAANTPRSRLGRQRNTPAHGRRHQPSGQAPIEVFNLISDEEDIVDDGRGDDDEVAANSTDPGAPSPLTLDGVTNVLDDDIDAVEPRPPTPVTPLTGTRNEPTSGGVSTPLGGDVELSDDMWEKQAAKVARIPDEEKTINKIRTAQNKKAVEIQKRAKDYEFKNLSAAKPDDTAYARHQKRENRELLKQNRLLQKKEKEERRLSREREKKATALKRKREAHLAKRQETRGTSDDSEGEDLPMLGRRTKSRTSAPPTPQRSTNQPPSRPSPARGRLQQRRSVSASISNAEFESRRRHIHDNIGQRAVNEVLSRDDIKLIDEWISNNYEMYEEGQTKYTILLHRERVRGARVLNLFNDGVWEIGQL